MKKKRIQNGIEYIGNHQIIEIRFMELFLLKKNPDTNSQYTQEKFQKCATHNSSYKLVGIFTLGIAGGQRVGKHNDERYHTNTRKHLGTQPLELCAQPSGAFKQERLQSALRASQLVLAKLVEIAAHAPANVDELARTRNSP
mgnify:CR=1 FL=1